MFLQNLRARIGARLSGDSEAGFTLIELLVVMLILGILAAIALPAFFNQKEKAGDANAKETAHTAQVATETYSTEHGGSYSGVSEKALHEIEPTLPQEYTAAEVTAGKPESNVAVVSEDSGKSYTITVKSTTGTNFQIANKEGTISFPCSAPGKGGCPKVGTVGNWGN